MSFDPVKFQFVLANERTFAAWIRTGLAFLAAGFAFNHFVTSQDQLLVRVLSTFLVGLSATCFIFSTLHFYHLEVRVAVRQLRGVPHLMLQFFSFSMVALAIITIILFWK
jgi:putative membrane protein